LCWLIGLATASLTTIAGSVASRDARSMSRLDVSMLLYLRLLVSIAGGNRSRETLLASTSLLLNFARATPD